MTVFNATAVGALEFTVSWQKDRINHEEWYLGRKFNAVNDIFPRGMREALEGKREGDSVTLTYEPRMCIPRHKDSLVRTIPMDRLRKKTIQGKPITLQLGRFYPQGHINGLLDIYPDTLTPFRLIGLDDDHFIADCNHPLATIPITIEARIQYLEPRETGTYGSLSHWREATCDWGPGMQAMFGGIPTNFFHEQFFQKQNAGEPSRAMDNNARDNLEALYARHIEPGMSVYKDEIDVLREQANSYDAVIFTQAFEYIENPVATLKAAADHLNPGGVVLIGFTNQFDATHVIQGWEDMHEFERMGLILEYLRQAGLDAEAGTYSHRNDWRDKSEPDFMEKKGISDPVYVVYGHKR